MLISQKGLQRDPNRTAVDGGIFNTAEHGRHNGMCNYPGHQPRRKRRRLGATQSWYPRPARAGEPCPARAGDTAGTEDSKTRPVTVPGRLAPFLKPSPREMQSHVSRAAGAHQRAGTGALAPVVTTRGRPCLSVCPSGEETPADTPRCILLTFKPFYSLCSKPVRAGRGPRGARTVWGDASLTAQAGPPKRAARD